MRGTPALLLIGLAVACQSTATQSTQLSNAQRAVIAAEVDSVCDGLWYPAWEAVDFERALTFIVDDPETAWVYEGQVIYTRAGIEEAFRPGAALAQSQEFNWTNSRTVVLAPDVAFTIREGSFVVTDTLGNVSPETPFAETTVWVKRGGEWKVLQGHGSTPTGGTD